MINSLCLIPELTCPLNCPYCYETTKKYGESLKWETYVSCVKNLRGTLPSLTEMLIDYNGVESGQRLMELMDPSLPTTITCGSLGLDKLMSLPQQVSIHLSIHSPPDIVFAIKNRSRISSVSVMIDDVDKLPLHQLEEIPIYFIYNKFGFMWTVRNFEHLYLSTIQRVQEFKQYTMDHCMLTRFNGQPCPASTQINLYRDGSTRRCPYQPKEPANADYTKGCVLIGAKK